MKFSTAILFAAGASALAVNKPRSLNARLVLRGATPAGLCPGIDSPVCCETDVDGVADLTCAQPATIPSSTSGFVKECAKTGLSAECCTLDVDGVGLICTSQSG